MKHLYTTIICIMCLALISAAWPAEARAFDLAGLARQFGKEGKRPGQQPPNTHPGPVGGPIGGPVGGPGGQAPGRQGAPEVSPAEEALIAELVVLLVGHAMNDLQQGAELYGRDGSDKNLNFLGYTANKVVSALQLDPRDGTFAPVLAALATGDAQAINGAVAAVDGELRANLESEAGAQQLWYYEAGRNISHVEFAIWEETQFNLLHFLNKSVTLSFGPAAQQAAGAGDFGAQMGSLQGFSGVKSDLIALVKQYMAIRESIEQRYGFPGLGLVLW